MKMKTILLFILSLTISAGVFFRYRSENKKSSCQKYVPLISGALLPSYIFVLCFMCILIFGVKGAAEMTLSMCFGIFLHISLYYLILIGMMPLFRKHISARTCAALWMIPNCLYLMNNNILMEITKPLLVIHPSEKIIWLFFGIWLAGFCLVFLWKIIAHFIFRYHVLKEATLVTDERTLQIWQDTLHMIEVKHLKRPLYISKAIKTPLSIGLFSLTTCVVLPDKSYTSDELRLIFRHEMIHISREDAWAKFFLVFCTAMCWFNPLMWIAMRKSADDLELSCDETVLLNCEDTKRHQYANLILQTAGDERGFTTCLSASALALSYRLKNIMHPGKRYSGAITIGILFFFLCMSSGYVSLAYEHTNGAEILYQSDDLNLCSLRYMTSTSDTDALRCTDEKAFHEYMAGLAMEKITGYYSFSESKKELSVIYETPDGTLDIILSDHMIKVVPLYDDDLKTTSYYLPVETDWAYLDTIIEKTSNGGL